MTWHHAHSHGHRTRRRHRHHRSGAFGPFAGRGRFFGPGEVRLALLSLLAEGPQHGYQLMKGLEERSGGTYRASAGSVYPTLQQLEDEGLVVAETLEGRRTLTLTDAGRAELESRSDDVDAIWRRADDWESWSGFLDPEAAELWRPIRKLLRSALRALARADGPERIDEIRDVLVRAREELDDLRR